LINFEKPFYLKESLLPETLNSFLFPTILCFEGKPVLESAGNGSLTVSWSKPTRVGRSPLRGYQVRLIVAELNDFDAAPDSDLSRRQNEASPVPFLSLGIYCAQSNKGIHFAAPNLALTPQYWLDY
jgi:hypothetical protein